MDDAKTENRLRFLISALYASAIAAAVYVTLKYFLPVCVPIIVGVVTALAGDALAARICRTVPRKRKTLRVICTVLIWLALTAAALTAGKLVYSQCVGLLVKLLDTDMLLQLDKLLFSLSDSLGGRATYVASEMTSALASMLKNLLSAALGASMKLPATLSSVAAAVMSGILFASDADRVKAFAVKAVPTGVFGKLRSMLSHFAKLLKAYGIMFLLNFTELSIGLSLLRVDYAIAAALLVALFDFMPILGSAMILVPWSVFLLLGGNTAQGVGMLILVAVTEGVRQTVEPKIVGAQLGIPAFASLAAAYVGSRFFGAAGVIAAPFIILIIKNFIKRGKPYVQTDNPVPNTPERVRPDRKKMVLAHRGSRDL